MIHEDEPIQHTHISYKDYKKIVNRNPRQGLIMFISVFCVLLIVFLGMAKVMSPDVEITLGDETTQTEDYVKPGEVDERLKEIHMEDNSEALGGEGLSIVDGGKVIIPKKNNSTQEEIPSSPVEDTVYLEETQMPPQAQPQERVEPVAQPSASVQTRDTAPVPRISGAKVVVGSYSNLEQAQVAKGILEEAGLGLSPFIRRIGNEYTIQVGSYNSKDKAMDEAKALLEKNYPARVLIEQ